MEFLNESCDRAMTLSRGHIRAERGCDGHICGAVVDDLPQVAEHVCRCLAGRMIPAPVEESIDRVSWFGGIIRRPPNRRECSIAGQVGESRSDQ